MDSRSAIKVQFIKEYARKDFQAITVKALCASTPVARTTFYSYFNNTDEVRCEIEDKLIRVLIAISEKVSGGDMNKHGDGNKHGNKHGDGSFVSKYTKYT